MQPGNPTLAGLLGETTAGRVLIADGAMGTALVLRGIAIDAVLAANLAYPEAVRAVHEEYAAAGARLLTANTFGLWQERDQDAVTAGWRIARDAADRAGCVPLLSVYPGALASGSGRRILDGLELHCAAVLIETCGSVDEMQMAARSVLSRGVAELAVSCHFRPDHRMADLSDPRTAARAMAEAGACLIGANCGQGPDGFALLARRLSDSIELPLIMQPSAGLPQPTRGGGDSYLLTPDAYAEAGAELFRAGVAIVGGCCGVEPRHIQALSARMMRDQPALAGEYTRRTIDE